MRHLLLAALALGLTTTAQAQFSDTEGFQLGASLYATSLTLDFDDASLGDEVGSIDDKIDFSGGGLGVRLGYGFSRLFTLYADLGAANVEAEDEDEGAAAHFELGGEFSFGTPAQQWVPFVNVALQGFAIGDEEDGDSYAFSGGGIKVGGGVSYFLTPQFAARAALSASAGSITQFNIESDGVDVSVDVEDATYTTGRLHLGVTYRF